MPGTPIVQLLQRTNTRGLNGTDFDKSRTQVIREAQIEREEAPCFGTDMSHDCAVMCEWRRECRKPVAAWLR
jgi:hypothetical protein